jgi:hypothetical protein
MSSTAATRPSSLSLKMAATSAPGAKASSKSPTACALIAKETSGPPTTATTSFANSIPQAACSRRSEPKASPPAARMAFAPQTTSSSIHRATSTSPTPATAASSSSPPTAASCSTGARRAKNPASLPPPTGKESGQFATAHGLAIDKQDRIYVADRGNKRVQIFDNSGKHLADWTGFGNPFGLLVVGDELLATEGDIHKIFHLDRQGKITASWGDPQSLLLPHLMAVNSKGTLFVTEVNGKRVQMFARAQP